MVKEIMYLLGRLFYICMGWEFEPLPAYFSKKHVVIGFPHTSNMDTVRAFAGFRIAKRTGHIMIKKEWFVWPVSVFLKVIGGIPVDRNSSQGVVEQMVEVFKKKDEFLLAIVPEGTRKRISTIKTGFWHIAKSANVTIICWYLDNAAKKTRWLGEIIPGISKRDDMIKIQEIYENAGYRFTLDISTLSEDGHQKNNSLKNKENRSPGA